MINVVGRSLEVRKIAEVCTSTMTQHPLNCCKHTTFSLPYRFSIGIVSSSMICVLGSVYSIYYHFLHRDQCRNFVGSKNIPLNNRSYCDQRVVTPEWSAISIGSSRFRSHRLTRGTEGFFWEFSTSLPTYHVLFLYICARAPLHHSQRLTPVYLGYIRRSTSCTSICINHIESIIALIVVAAAVAGICWSFFDLSHRQNRRNP